MAAEDFRVVVVGGGVGGLEAILALREADPNVNIELLSDDTAFRLVALSVTEPFGAEAAPELPIDDFCEDVHASRHRDRLAEIWPAEQRLLTEHGTELPYDALILSPGARRHTPAAESKQVAAGAPQALIFAGAGQAKALRAVIEEAAENGGTLLFEVPAGPSWPLPLYELALQAAQRLSETAARVAFQTPEHTPLQCFGAAASAQVADLLEMHGIEFSSTGGVPADGGREVEPTYRVTIPELDVPEIPGLPQNAHGFIPTDRAMRVPGAERVWAVGDATWFPIKQGGLAAEQADVAAAGIAAEIGHPVADERLVFRPILRAALMTPEGPHFLRSAAPDADSGDQGTDQHAPLWWPPAKVAGRLLAPYLARRHDPTDDVGELRDLEPESRRESDHAEAIGIALVGADIDARDGEYTRALHWLDVAEGLNIVLPAEYREKRKRWTVLAAATGQSH